ncbi:MAG: hypothetical protein HC799_02910 [Limnothrix sp. RL_2_0]|nr:hypothetical protein [Limnothrix sp. RL_2_0]
MLPDLFSATQDYWQKLDRLEARYQRGELPIEAVDAEVKRLMTDLSAERRRALSAFGYVLRHWFTNNRQAIASFSFIVLTIYAWFTVASIA